jgi:hypothetical protein
MRDGFEVDERVDLAFRRRARSSSTTSGLEARSAEDLD